MRHLSDAHRWNYYGVQRANQTGIARARDETRGGAPPSSAGARLAFRASHWIAACSWAIRDDAEDLATELCDEWLPCGGCLCDTADGHVMVGLVLADVAVPVWVSLVLVNDVNVGRHYEIDASQPLNLLSVRCRFFFCCVFTSIPPRFSPKGERGYVLKRQRQHYPFYKFMFRFLLRFHWLQCALSLTAVISLTSLLFMAKNKIVLKNWRHKYVLSPSKIRIGFCYKKVNR